MAREAPRAPLPPEQVTIPPGHSWNRIPAIAGIVALLGAAVCGLAGPRHPQPLFFSRALREPDSVHRRHRGASRRRSVRLGGPRQSEAVLLLVAGVVPVLPEPR